MLSHVMFQNFFSFSVEGWPFFFFPTGDLWWTCVSSPVMMNFRSHTHKKIFMECCSLFQMGRGTAMFTCSNWSQVDTIGLQAQKAVQQTYREFKQKSFFFFWVALALSLVIYHQLKLDEAFITLNDFPHVSHYYKVYIFYIDIVFIFCLI